ncbi:MAG: hypothetical protein A2V58_00875 [Candidatus Muproteobacteria bacterium RBG_19FT_COMBO_61_10]|uniref:Uncharacterized protein n=1 Tax=Candidatus Muproteobacteria bacterium RBG_19FT_COMBO_61_10 TaxID=1817761 RepID=A0A1F6UKH9_9PROT|nr:MAG: hypothetical protein A2V58_00875 [Candidatus Muproteobacteria bacterium RBG_19FT_COMBO_61_10]
MELMFTVKVFPPLKAQGPFSQREKDRMRGGPKLTPLTLSPEIHGGEGIVQWFLWVIPMFLLAKHYT